MSTQFSRTRIAVLSMTALVACGKNAADAPPANPAVAASRDATPSGRVVRVNASAMARIGAVDPRFVSYNIEMLEVTGGNFWKACGNPTNGGAKPVQPSSSVPPG